MASETKAGTSRRKSSVEPKAVVSKPAIKAAAKPKTTASKTTADKAATVKAAPKKAASTKTDNKATTQTKKPVAKKTAAPRKTKATGQPITAEARLRHIELAAYYVAERSGFSRSPADCWIAAESEIDGLLLGGKLSA